MDDASRRDTKRLRLTDSAPTFDSLPLMSIAAFLDSTKDLCSLAATCKQALVDVEQHSKLLLDKIIALHDDTFQQRLQGQSFRVIEGSSFRFRLSQALVIPIARANARNSKISPSCSRWAALDEDEKLVVYDIGSTGSLASLARHDIPPEDATGNSIPNWERFGYCFVDDSHIALLFNRCILLWHIDHDGPAKNMHIVHNSAVANRFGHTQLFLSLPNGEFLFPTSLLTKVEFFKLRLQGMTVEKCFQIETRNPTTNIVILGITLEKFITFLIGSELCVIDLETKKLCHQQKYGDLYFPQITIDSFGTNGLCVLDKRNNQIENWRIDDSNGSILKSPLCRFSSNMNIECVLALQRKQLFVVVDGVVGVLNLIDGDGDRGVPIKSSYRRVFGFLSGFVNLFSLKNNSCSVGDGAESKLYLLGMPKL